jgi:hypothetical protein
VPHVCSLCGQIAFATMHEYETHRRVTHGLRERIRPTKTTNRTHDQIVRDAESTWLAPYLLRLDAPAVPAHGAGCACTACFNVRLDALLERQERDQ